MHSFSTTLCHEPTESNLCAEPLVGHVFISFSSSVIHTVLDAHSQCLALNHTTH